MKKLKIFVSIMAIAGMLFVTSCVDDNESPSVTDLRKAKTEQLRAEAALATAQAEAAKIVAEGQKILAEAQAAYQKASADKLNAETEADKKLAEQELKRITAETELALEQLKNALAEEELRTQAELISLQRQLEALNSEEHPALSQAIADYRTHLAAVNSAKAAIANMKIDLVRNQATLAGSVANEQETRDAIVRGLNVSLGQEEGKLANLKKSLVSWNAVLSEANTLEATIKAKKAEYDELIARRPALYKDYQEKRVIYLEVNAAYYEFLALIDGWGITGGITSLEEINILIAAQEAYVAELAANIVTESAKLDALKPQVAVLYQEWQDAIAAYNSAEEALTVAEDALQVIMNNGVLPGDTDYDLALANVTVKTNERNLAMSTRNNAETEYRALLADIDTVEKAIWSYTGYHLTAVYDKEELEKLRDAFEGDPNKLRTLGEQMIEAIWDNNYAARAYNALAAEISAMQDELSTLNTIYINSQMFDIENGGGTSGNVNALTIEAVKAQLIVVEEAIITSEKAIKQIERDIVEANADTAKAIALLEQAIKDLEADIAYEEAQLKIAEAQAAAARKIIDEYTK